MSCRGCKYEKESSSHYVCVECLEYLHEYRKWTKKDAPQNAVEGGGKQPATPQVTPCHHVFKLLPTSVECTKCGCVYDTVV